MVTSKNFLAKCFCIFICLVLNQVNAFNYLTYNATQDISQLINKEKIEIKNKQYLEDLEIAKKSQESALLTVCMLQARNFLYYNSNPVSSILKNTKYSKDQVFDRIVIELYNTCKKELEKSDFNRFLHPDKVLSYDDYLMSKLKLDESKFEVAPSFSPADHELLKIFYKGSLSKQKKAEQDESKKNIVNFSASTPIIENSFMDSIQEININVFKYVVYGLIMGVILGFVVTQLLAIIKKRRFNEIKAKDKKKKN